MVLEALTKVRRQHEISGKGEISLCRDAKAFLLTEKMDEYDLILILRLLIYSKN